VLRRTRLFCAPHRLECGEATLLWYFVSIFSGVTASTSWPTDALLWSAPLLAFARREEVVMDPAPIPSTNVPPQPIIVQQHLPLFGRFGKLLLAALGIAIVIIFVLIAQYRTYFNSAERPQERFHSLSSTALKKIAIISVDGTILDAEDGFIKRQIDRVKEDENVVAVVLRIDSPGGTVTASDYLYHHLRQLAEERELPIVVSMGSLCASGGYYIAMAAGTEPDVIFAEPTTWTGSIGVVIPHYDFSGLLGRIDVKDDSVASGPLKLMASPTRPMTEEDRKLLQQLVDETYARSKTIPRRSTPWPPARFSRRSRGSS
jgi:protease IV